jgi:hypothetical protein
VHFGSLSYIRHSLLSHHAQREKFTNWHSDLSIYVVGVSSSDHIFHCSMMTTVTTTMSTSTPTTSLRCPTSVIQLHIPICSPSVTPTPSSTIQIDRLGHGKNTDRIARLESIVTDLVSHSNEHRADMANLTSRVSSTEQCLSEHALAFEAQASRDRKFDDNFAAIQSQLSEIAAAVTSSSASGSREKPTSSAQPAQHPKGPPALYTKPFTKILLFGDSNMRSMPEHYSKLPAFAKFIRSPTLYDAMDNIKAVHSADAELAPSIIFVNSGTNDLVENSADWALERVTELETVVSNRFPSAKLVIFAPPPRIDLPDLTRKVERLTDLLRPRESVTIVNYDRAADLRSDGIHLTISGISALLESILSLCKQYNVQPSSITAPVHDRLIRGRGWRGFRGYGQQRGRGFWGGSGRGHYDSYTNQPAPYDLNRAISDAVSRALAQGTSKARQPATDPNYQGGYQNN